MNLRMSTVISEIILDIRDDIEDIIPNPDYLDRLFNRGQKEIALETGCIPLEIALTIDGYTAESAKADDDDGEAVTNSRILRVADADLANEANDYYNEWLLENTTRKDSAYITDTVVAGGITTFYLSRAITGQVAGDSFTIKRLRQTWDMPWYVIRPHLEDGVKWENYPLNPESVPVLKSYHRDRNTYGTPRLYAIEGQKIWLFPQPGSTGVLSISGTRRPADCFRVATTSNGSARGDTIISTAIPSKADDYYRGSEVEIMLTSSYIGEVRTVDEYDAANVTLYFKTPFSGQIDSGDTVELLSGLSEDFRGAIDEFIKGKLYMRKTDKNLRAIGHNHLNNYAIEKESLRRIHLRKNTAHGNMRRSVSIGKPYTFSTRSR